MTKTEAIDWRNLPPLTEEEMEAITVPSKPSQTFLKHHDVCDRAAYLYLRYRAGAGSHELNRGAVVHDVIAQLTNECVNAGQSKVDPVRGKQALVDYMDENPHLQLSAKERDAARYMIRNWCLGSWFQPERVLAVETTLTMQIGDWTILGRVDLAEELGHDTIQVVDYKTSFDMPDGDEWKGESFDSEGKPRWSGNFQTQLYALLLAEGTLDDGDTLGDEYNIFRMRLLFPRYLKPEGLAYRGAVMTREQLLDFKIDVESQLRRLSEVNIEQRKWQPTPGNHCRECPAEYACPLPKLLRPESQHAELNTIEDLEKAGAAWMFMSKRAGNLKARIKKAATRIGDENPDLLELDHGDKGVYIGTDQALVFIHAENERRKTKAHEFRSDIEAAAEYGRPLDWEKHFTYSESTKFEKRNVPRRRANGRSK